MDVPASRIGYIRTISGPVMEEDQTFGFLRTYVKQDSTVTLQHNPRHFFIFGATTTTDAHILNIFLHNQPSQGGGLFNFNSLKTSDVELRISETRANTPAGTKLIRRCEAGGIQVVVQGKSDEDCDEMMLQQSHYIIDRWTTGDGSYYDHEWFLSTARSGCRQDNMLTNPDYKVSQHDASKTRLRDRYAGHGWNASSGAYHGNAGNWRCHCGRKCKRGRCRFEPGEDQPVPAYVELPERGSQEWYELSAADTCRRVASRRWYFKRGDPFVFRSIDTFTGE